MRRSEAEFEDFVIHRSGELLRTAYLLCGGDQGAAEDLLQDVLERMFGRWRRITESPSSYARAALANAAANRWRRLSRRARETSWEYDVRSAEAGPEETVTERDAILRALRTLPPRARAVIVLRYFDDMSEADIARALGCRPGTVKSQAARGLAILRQSLSQPTDHQQEGAPA
ncbi:SigE family RNA polymerase sigma factor [Actinoalloteichus hymeniacidonis]|uniref:RNA polymerase sigma-70 factor, sigma-E family n=1 Tax=Actinoalloteichus hymeniacidonis TaxID=340345 RepID=A0AAC9HN67_9PSEU|nr:SigE family RNA polymerase sigma factor [Actinoalloteichus hymeniacidonis]AOS62287.1 RNA polymerase sigma-70 factor, sigma-E family [Actinoalloteichus hymeniacidonis]MBB5909687.1 RNA polymerase sigma-70 factor (sigma-E family) [Actinoalloteichus hymeniacidonis]